MTQGRLSNELIKQQLTDLFPAEEPSPELRARVAALALQQQEIAHQAAARQRGRRLVLAAAGAAVLGGLLEMTLPPLAAARMLRRMDGVMRDARSAHFILRRVQPDGSSVKIGETWYQDGAWRMENVFETGPRTQIFANGKLWSYDSKADTVTVERRSSPFGYPSAGFSLTALLGSGASGKTADSPQDLGETTINGRRAHQVAIISAAGERMVFSADPDTDLPFHMDVQRKTDHGWELGATGDMDYNQPLPKRLFVPDFPRTARVRDIDASVRALHQRWINGIARQRAGDRTVVIRDLQVNAEGDVFLLYTAGHYPGDWQDDVIININDDAGNHYNRGREIGTHFRGNKAGLVFNGEQLEGICTIAPVLGRQVHQLTIKFDCTPVPRHGIRDMPVPGVRYELLGRNPVTAVFTLPIHERIPSDLPDYMPYMPFPVTEQDLEELRGRH
ncbi:MAG: hypothetical protein JO250_02380 [Armatimonadetes bacterium]|nr:hypothetical protein [Armatimonadota bacterium]